MKIAKKALLPSAEREMSHWCGYPYIYPDISGNSVASEFSGCCSAPCKNACGISILSIIYNGYCFIQALNMNDAK